MFATGKFCFTIAAVGKLLWAASCYTTCQKVQYILKIFILWPLKFNLSFGQWLLVHGIVTQNSYLPKISLVDRRKYSTFLLTVALHNLTLFYKCNQRAASGNGHFVFQLFSLAMLSFNYRFTNSTAFLLMKTFYIRIFIASSTATKLQFKNSSVDLELSLNCILQPKENF